eukprot:TRINITY_DN10269_c0_g1_i1.p1 TRINITY_DN10269_c0_g1~~TRINITY_DN10269_c0_g1_i1.p1  ORF type:complete len:348 (+),score=38.67 TRINITY_DN10269_c0_g1_i1:26-1069(+)
MAECRICKETEDASSPLIIPCHCRGSVAHAHATCLLQWVLVRHGAVVYTTAPPVRCEVCRTPLRFAFAQGSRWLDYWWRRPPATVQSVYTFGVCAHVGLALAALSCWINYGSLPTPIGVTLVTVLLGGLVAYRVEQRMVADYRTFVVVLFPHMFFCVFAMFLMLKAWFFYCAAHHSAFTEHASPGSTILTSSQTTLFAAHDASRLVPQLEYLHQFLQKYAMLPILGVTLALLGYWRIPVAVLLQTLFGLLDLIAAECRRDPLAILVLVAEVCLMFCATGLLLFTLFLNFVSPSALVGFYLVLAAMAGLLLPECLSKQHAFRVIVGVLPVLEEQRTATSPVTCDQREH